jgi:Protein of unknown function (DUF1393).
VRKWNAKSYVVIGMLSAISYVLMLLDFPLPMFPSFLKVDFSDIPALVASIILGPAAGIVVELLKNVIDFLTTGSETGIPVGHIANFITGISFIVPAYFLFAKVKSKKGMALALGAATLFTAFAMSILNYFVFLPMYAYFLNLQMPANIIVTAILPFNLVKGIIVSIVFLLLFSKMDHWLRKQQSAFRRAGV